jgi:hypothetical protein
VGALPAAGVGAFLPAWADAFLPADVGVFVAAEAGLPVGAGAFLPAWADAFLAAAAGRGVVDGAPAAVPVAVRRAVEAEPALRAGLSIESSVTVLPFQVAFGASLPRTRRHGEGELGCQR